MSGTTGWTFSRWSRVWVWARLTWFDLGMNSRGPAKDSRIGKASFIPTATPPPRTPHAHTHTCDTHAHTHTSVHMYRPHQVIVVKPKGPCIGEGGFMTDGNGVATGTPMSEPSLIREISEDPVLANTKLIAEAWDCDGLVQVGRRKAGRGAAKGLQLEGFYFCFS
eukprot:233975-Chlamydomonas_euryale.AAC.1